MPAFERAQLTAELKVLPSGEDGSRAEIEAAKTAAGESGLAHEAGPDTMVLAGERREVLDAGAGGVELRIEAQGDAPRFGEQG